MVSVLWGTFSSLLHGHSGQVFIRGQMRAVRLMMPDSAFRRTGSKTPGGAGTHTGTVLDRSGYIQHLYIISDSQALISRLSPCAHSSSPPRSPCVLTSLRYVRVGP